MFLNIGETVTKKRFLPLLATSMLLGVIVVQVSNTSVASADVGHTEYTVPSGVNPLAVHAHGSNNNFTVTDNSCSYANTSSSSQKSAVTEETSGNSSQTTRNIVDKVKDGWSTNTCPNTLVAGADETIYYVRSGTNPYPQQFVASRNNMILWSTYFEDPDTACTRDGRPYSPRMGVDGNLYLVVQWSATSSQCVLKEALIALDPSTGARKWAEDLPETGIGSLHTEPIQQQMVYPYEDGIAVLNGTSIYHYNYSGTQQTGTFTPSWSGGSILKYSVVHDTGRVFLLMRKYNGAPNHDYSFKVYYKDLSSSTITEISMSTATGISEAFATPSNGVVVAWNSSSNRYFTYFDSTITQVYQQYLNTETGSVFSANGLGHIVDDDGNVIVRRQFDVTGSNQDRNVIIDSFSPSGVKTRLFNSANHGTSGVIDSWTSTSPLQHSVGGGYMYIVLCRKTGSYTTACNSSGSPKVYRLDVASSSDYGRSVVFEAETGSGILEYVALGDSFSSGEGNPGFIPPSDINECDRSYNAYPVLLANRLNSVRLRAFRACSGATISSVYQGKNTEPGQLDSLSTSTNIVTITIGGNDVFFKEFAQRCVLIAGSCDDTSAEYIDSINAINSIEFQDSLLEQLEQIRIHAPNADVYVAGYPQVFTSDTQNCSSFVSSEVQAARTIVSQLNDKIQYAVADAGNGFMFVDPESSGSRFHNHGLCDNVSYIHHFNPLEHVFSFHPDENGHEAYADLFESAMN